MTLHKKGAAYGTLNSARSAIALLHRNETADPLVQRFVKGAFRIRPSKPKYEKTWDVGIVLDFLERWWPLESLSLMQLSQRLVVLLALSTAQRPQTLACIRLSQIQRSETGIEIKISDLIKTSRPEAHQPLLHLPYMANNPKLCVPTTVFKYTEVTAHSRGQEDRLIITTTKPIHAVSSETISRWIRQVLTESGIDPDFTGYSTRHAATSAAARQGVLESIIKQTAGWSARSQVFAKHYNRPITQDRRVFATTVLGR